MVQSRLVQLVQSRLVLYFSPVRPGPRWFGPLRPGPRQFGPVCSGLRRSGGLVQCAQLHSTLVRWSGLSVLRTWSNWWAPAGPAATGGRHGVAGRWRAEPGLLLLSDPPALQEEAHQAL